MPTNSDPSAQLRGQVSDRTVGAPPERGEGPSGTQLSSVVSLVRDRYELGQGGDHVPWAIRRDGPNIARPLDSAAMRSDLAALCHEELGVALSTSTLSAAMTIITGYASRVEPRDAYLRLARRGSSVVLDLGDVTGRAVVVGPDGWRTVRRPRERFLRTELTAAYPRPLRGRSIEVLRRFLNVDSAGFDLVVGYAVAALVDVPMPPLVVLGEQDAGKSTFMKTLSLTLDPSAVAAHAPPRSEEQWIVAASGSRVIALDNVSSIAPWLSDAICRAVYGDAVVTRTLYTNAGRHVQRFQRIIMLNGISPSGIRGDLISRSLPLELQPISRRIRERELWQDFDAAGGAIFGALLDLVAEALSALPSVDQDLDDRMSDFCRVLAAVDEVRGTSAVATYRASRARFANDGLDDDEVSVALRGFMEHLDGPLTLTPAELYLQLHSPHGSRFWPANPAALSRRINRLAPGLRGAGYTVTPGRSNGQRVLSLERMSRP